MSIFTRRLNLVLLSSATLFAGGSAAAQTATDAGSNDSEIIVTAQKRQQRAQDVGISLNVYSGTELQRAGALNAPDIAKFTPGVGVSGSFAGQNVMFSIRGITQQDFQAHSEAPIAVYIDETYLAANNAAAVGLFDIERVEILKGPQGTLFGRNATGGLVSITTRKPTDQLSAQASASYGSYNDVRLEAGVGGPIGEKVQARIAGLYQRNDGWVDNISPTGGDLGGKEGWSVRGQLAFEPNETVNMVLTGFASNVDQSWGPYMLLSTRSVLNGAVPDAVIVSSPTLFGAPPSDEKDLIVNANNAQSRGGYNRIAGATFKSEIDLGAASLTSITDYKRLKYKLALDDDASAISFLDTIATARVENWSQELRLFYGTDQAKFTGGFYYLHIKAGQVDLQRLFGLGGVQVSSPFELKTNSYSGFAQAEYELTPQVTLLAGLRATREEKDYRFDSFVQQLDGTPLVTGRSIRASSGKWLFTGKAQLEYRPKDDIMLYVGYNRGAKAGSFNAPFAGGATPIDSEVPYKAEKLDAYEIGFKTMLADRRVTFNGAAFYYDYHDFQAFKFVNFSTVVGNNPATIKGAEFEVKVKAAEGLDLLLGGSYIDAKVKGVVVSNSLGSATVDRRPPFTSKWKIVGAATYSFDLAGGSASVQGDFQYTGPFYFSLTNFQATHVDGNTLLNARVAWQTADKKWEFAVFGRNLSDERYRTVGFEASDFGGFTQTGYGEPRWIGASVSFRY